LEGLCGISDWTLLCPLRVIRVAFVISANVRFAPGSGPDSTALTGSLIVLGVCHQGGWICKTK
jgi:hypothetical protein